jgi:uncharacterized membrane protein
MYIKRTFWILLWTLPLLFCTWLMIRITFPYFSFEYDISFLLTKQRVLHKPIWRLAFYTHISSSLLVLFLGIFQFIPIFLKKFPQLHRTMGKAYVLLILCVSAPSGFVMSLYANGGLWTKISFSLISVLWFMFTLQAYRKIKNRNIQAHTDFMIRSYALTLSAITLRTYVVILPHFFILHSREMYTLISWLSWVPNLLLAELFIRKRIFHPY